MHRRLYFLFPEVEHTRHVVEELEKFGVEKSHMHTMARKDIDLSTLPAATASQKRDRIWRLERWVWSGNLMLFSVALLGLLVSLYWSFSMWSALALLVMLTTFFAGDRFAVKVPHAHLDEVRGALAHGEILLMVDIPRKRVAEIEQLVLRHHPEAQLGAVGWTVEALGV